jgi:hypothetical protein
MVWQRLELAGADQGAGQMQERGEDVGAALVADSQGAVGQRPGQRSLDLPAVTTQTCQPRAWASRISDATSVAGPAPQTKT